jgi:hypothetical protein
MKNNKLIRFSLEQNGGSAPKLMQEGRFSNYNWKENREYKKNPANLNSRGGLDVGVSKNLPLGFRSSAGVEFDEGKVNYRGGLGYNNKGLDINTNYNSSGKLNASVNYDSPVGLKAGFRYSDNKGEKTYSGNLGYSGEKIPIGLNTGYTHTSEGHNANADLNFNTKNINGNFGYEYNQEGNKNSFNAGVNIPFANKKGNIGINSKYNIGDKQPSVNIGTTFKFKNGGDVSDKKDTLSKLKKALSLRENLGNLDTEQGYNTPLKQVLRTAIGLEGKDYSNKPMSSIAREQDAFRMYLGLPSRTGAFEQTGSNKYRIRDYGQLYPETMPSDEAVLYSNKINKAVEMDKSPVDLNKLVELTPYADILMGTHNVVKDKDAKGEYLKYYDRFDFDPTRYANQFIDRNVNPTIGKYLKKATPVLDELESLIFNPFELEDKVYYNPKTKLRSDIILQQNRQRVVPGQPIAIPADFQSGGEMIKRNLWDNIGSTFKFQNAGQKNSTYTWSTQEASKPKGTDVKAPNDTNITKTDVLTDKAQLDEYRDFLKSKYKKQDEEYNNLPLVKMQSLYSDKIENFSPETRFGEIPENPTTVNLTQGRFNTAKVPTYVIDQAIESAKRNNRPVGELLALIGRESTFGQQKSDMRGTANKKDLISGWNLAEKYEPYDYMRFLADKGVEGIIAEKDRLRTYYDFDPNGGREQVFDYVNRNPKLLEEYKKKLESQPQIGNQDYFDLAYEFLKDKGIKKYNPGDPKYESMYNEDFQTLEKEPALQEYLKSKGVSFSNTKYQQGGNININSLQMQNNNKLQTPSEAVYSALSNSYNINTDMGLPELTTLEQFKNGGYKVIRTNERKGKTHKVIAPDGKVQYFGDAKLGQHPRDPERKKAFYARHKKNLEKNPLFRAFARETWQDGGELNKLGVENSLWNNIRENRGSGRKPTKEMLEQEKKIKAKEMQSGGSVQDKEMVDGIANILSQIKDKSNRKQVAKNMIKDFNNENVNFNYDNFLQAINLDRLKNGGGIDLNEQFIVGNYQGGGINLDPSKKGTFKVQATRMGVSVQEAANKILSAPEGEYSPEMRRKANFARNFAKQDGGVMDDMVYINGAWYDKTTMQNGGNKQPAYSWSTQQAPSQANTSIRIPTTSKNRGIIARPLADFNKELEEKRQKNIKLEQERKAAINRANLAQSTQGFPTTPEELAAQVAVEEKFTIPYTSPLAPLNYFNVFKGIGSMSNELAYAPLNVKRGEYLKAATAVAQPLLLGHIAGAHGNIAANLVNPVAGVKNAVTSLAKGEIMPAAQVAAKNFLKKYSSENPDLIDLPYAIDKRFVTTKEVTPTAQQPLVGQNGGLTPKKAREILHDGTVHGKPITEQQRKYFGYISSKKQDGGAVTMTGYRQDSPDVNNAFNYIPSKNISMGNVVGDVNAVDRFGNVTTMKPNENYVFPNGGVLEYRPKKGRVKFSM